MGAFGIIEFLFIFLLSFIVIGPKDFPKVMFWIGDNLRKFRWMSQNFYQQWEEAAADKEDLEDFKKTTTPYEESSK